MKTCNICKQQKEESCFYKNNNRSDKLQTFCKICGSARSKKYYHKNKNEQLPKIYKRRKINNNKNRKNFAQYLKEHACIICGESNILKLQCDHLRDKRDEVTQLLIRGYSWDIIKNELDKCQILCANCHMEKTQIEQKSWRLKYL